MLGLCSLPPHILVCRVFFTPTSVCHVSLSLSVSLCSSSGRRLPALHWFVLRLTCTAATYLLIIHARAPLFVEPSVASCESSACS